MSYDGFRRLFVEIVAQACEDYCNAQKGMKKSNGRKWKKYHDTAIECEQYIKDNFHMIDANITAESVIDKLKILAEQPGEVRFTWDEWMYHT